MSEVVRVFYHEAKMISERQLSRTNYGLRGMFGGYHIQHWWRSWSRD